MKTHYMGIKAILKYFLLIIISLNFLCSPIFAGALSGTNYWIDKSRGNAGIGYFSLFDKYYITRDEISYVYTGSYALDMTDTSNWYNYRFNFTANDMYVSSDYSGYTEYYGVSFIVIDPSIIDISSGYAALYYNDKKFYIPYKTVRVLGNDLYVLWNTSEGIPYFGTRTTMSNPSVYVNGNRKYPSLFDVTGSIGSNSVISSVPAINLTSEYTETQKTALNTLLELLLSKSSNVQDVGGTHRFLMENEYLPFISNMVGSIDGIKAKLEDSQLNYIINTIINNTNANANNIVANTNTNAGAINNNTNWNRDVINGNTNTNANNILAKITSAINDINNNTNSKITSITSQMITQTYHLNRGVQ